MRPGRFLALGLILAASAAPQAVSLARAPAAKAPSLLAATRDWSQTVAATPEGGVRMGNPNAPLKLIEFGSISCNHCAEFNEKGAPVLRGSYVRSGRVSWEYRPFMIFPTDPGIFLLLNCLGPAGFFSASDRLYTQQEQWVGRLQQMSESELSRIQSLPPPEMAAAFTRATGVDQMFRERGLLGARVDTCFADEARLLRLAEISRVGRSLGVTGTPSFMLNGRLLDNIHSWDDLEPFLKQGG